MEAEISEDPLTTELFDALPESVIWFKPVKENGGEVLDFEVGYCNDAACFFLTAPKEVLLGQRVLTNTLLDEEYKFALFKQCLKVWQSGKPHEESFYNEHLGKYFSALRSKVKGGVISVTRDRTEFFHREKERQEQAKKFTGILDASADGLLLLEAIRNKEHEIVDFRITHCNKAGLRLGRFSPDAVGKTLLEVLPHLRFSEQFQLHKQVINTGEPVRIETTFRDENGREYGWFIVSMMKMGDSVVSSFVDISEKKTNEEKIEEQADLLHSIFEASINAIFACEATRNEEGKIINLTILKINQAFTKIIGKTAAETEGKDYLHVFPMAKKYGFYNSYCEVIETGKSIRNDIYYEGENLRGWYDVSAVKRGNNGIVVTFTDVTQIKETKRVIEEAALYLQDVIDSTQTGIFSMTPVKNELGELVDFRFKTVNRTLAKYAHKEAAELVGKLHNEIFPGSVEELFQRYKKIYEGTEVEHRFENHYQANGTDAWFDLLVKKRGDDLFITFLDFTPLKKLQVEISAAAEKLSTVINTSHAGMFTLRPVYSEAREIEDFRFVIVNQAVATYIGETAENLSGALASIYFPAYKTNGLFDTYRDTLLNNTPHSFDFHYEDGYDVYFNIHTVKAGDEVLVTFTDHTSLKRLQHQLENTITELKHSNANLEEFAYAASHDLQEPLRKIQYFSERLRKGVGGRLSEDETKMFERMENAARRMTLLINDLLVYSQVSAKKVAEFTAVDLKAVVQQVLNDLETSIAEKGATVSIGALPTVNGDGVQLQQLFQNIIGNSIKYSKKDVPPVIKISSAPTSKQVNGSRKPYQQIEITDNGIGFEQEHASRIFKIFHRLHGQSEFPGTGIGLAIVHKVIDNHNGFISATGRVDEGATFTILLPEDGKA